MSKPYLHAKSSARKFGGNADDYLKIHQFMDSSKGCFPDNRHRALTHNSWFIAPGGPLELIFGVNITNSESKLVSVRDIGEQHIQEDFGHRFIPSVDDYLSEMNPRPWMSNAFNDYPNSYKKIKEQQINFKDKD